MTKFNLIFMCKGVFLASYLPLCAHFLICKMRTIMCQFCVNGFQSRVYIRINWDNFKMLIPGPDQQNS